MKHAKRFNLYPTARKLKIKKYNQMSYVELLEEIEKMAWMGKQPKKH